MHPKMRAFSIAAAVSLVALTYPISVVLKLGPGSDYAVRWIKNDPAFNFFMPFIFPFAVGIFFASVSLKPFKNLGSYKVASYAGLAVLLFLTTFVVASTRDRPFLEPFLFINSGEALDREVQFRKAIKPVYRGLAEIHDEKQRRDAETALGLLRSSSIASYESNFPGFKTFSDMRQRGSYCAWLALLINAMVGLFIVVFFWYLWNVVLFRSVFRLNKPEWIMLVAGLLVFWFPLRLYTEWYIGFYSFETMKGYYIFYFMAVVAVTAYAFCVFKLAKSFEVKLFSVVGTGLFGLIGVIGKLQPVWLGAVANTIEDMPFQWFSASMAIIVLALGAMVLSLLEIPNPSSSAQRREPEAGRGSRRSRHGG